MFKKKNKTKNTEVYLSETACIRCGLNTALRIFLIWGFFVYMNKGSEFHSLIVILALPLQFISFWIVIKGIKIRSNNSIIYQGSFEDLIKKMYVHGFALNEKIGELYVFRTHYFLFKSMMLVKSNGSSCVLFGDYPKQLYTKANEDNSSGPDGATNKKSSFI